MSPEEALAALNDDKPVVADIKVSYCIVLRKPGTGWIREYWPVPWWMDHAQGLAAAKACRDALRSQGLDVALVQDAVVRDVIE